MTPGEKLFRQAMRALGRDHAPAAARLLRESAALDWVPAHRQLGVFYEYGVGVRRNGTKAHELYERAAIAGDADAMYRLALTYLDGFGTRVNRKKAATWFERAAEAGVPEAIHCLGMSYRYGSGVPKNARRGFQCHQRAAKAGVVEAQFSLGVWKCRLSSRFRRMHAFVQGRDRAARRVCHRARAAASHGCAVAATTAAAQMCDFQ
jgi:TPR repeat protein